VNFFLQDCHIIISNWLRIMGDYGIVVRRIKYNMFLSCVLKIGYIALEEAC
jgi:hypothetical protein